MGNQVSQMSCCQEKCCLHLNKLLENNNKFFKMYSLNDLIEDGNKNEESNLNLLGSNINEKYIGSVVTTQIY
tara:strand:+ start:298 stop:513 length:216 start_codon:yes stop_codon:yes gene_type:complete